MQPDQQMLEALVNLATNGVLDRIDNRAKRAPNCGSGDCTRTILSQGARCRRCAFKEVYPLVLVQAGDAAVVRYHWTWGHSQ